ncbi:exonuclease II Exo2, partial [Coemansia sp. RSA 2598]
DDASAPYAGQAFRSPPSSVEPMCRHYIMSLQWVLMYYFHGCQSWSWFYPYHYAPCISDVCANLAAYKVENFNNDPPYTPYEQLMCVLPPYSRKLLPAPLRALMVDVHSPIRDMFPTSFEVDMNGKKMPWEAVVLINFVDIERIRAAMVSKLPLLSEDETKRNSRGKNMLYSYAPLDVDEDSDDLPEYQAPSCLKFPPIRPIRCKGMLFVMPSLKAKSGNGSLQLIRGLVEGSVTRAHMRPGFPSLFTVSHTGKLAFNATEVFGFPSKDESLVVTLLPDSLSQKGSAQEISAELVGGKRVHGAYRPRRVFVAWPYLRDAVLVGVSDENGVYTVDASGAKVVYCEHGSPVERGIWKKKHMDSVFQAKKMQAVILGDSPKILVHVLPLRGMKLYPNGSLVREYGFPTSGQRGAADRPWADIDEWVQLGVQTYHPGVVLTDLSGAWVNNPRFAEHAAMPLERSLPVASRVFFIGRTPLYGHPGKIVDHAKDRSGSVVGVDIQLVANADIGATKYANYLGVNTLAHRHHIGGERYRPSYVVAREIGMSPLLLSRITSKMTIMDTTKSGDAARLHIGLDLKFEAKRLKVIGYTKRGPNGWLFSDRAVDLISRYKANFPDMFARLDRRSDKDMLTASECFAPEQASDADGDAGSRKFVAKQVERLKSWHKANVDRSAMVQVPIESELLTKGEIDAIVAAQAQIRQGATKKILLRDIRREAVLRPADAQYLLKNQSLMIGHRVVYVSDRSGSVPLGAKGYIVGIHAKDGNSEQQTQTPNQSASSQHMAKVRQEGVSADMIHMVEVVFDKEFIDGTTLEGRCPAYRGALVPPYQVLDLTSWGLGQNVSSKPTAAPRAVDTIKPAPDTVSQRHGIGAGQTARIAAKVRATFNRPAAVTVVDGEGSGALSVVVQQEPTPAPWASNSTSMSEKAPANSSHATRIISQLTSALGKQGPES